MVVSVHTCNLIQASRCSQIQGGEGREYSVQLQLNMIGIGSRKVVPPLGASRTQPQKVHAVNQSPASSNARTRWVENGILYGLGCDPPNVKPCSSSRVGRPWPRNYCTDPEEGNSCVDSLSTFSAWFVS